MLLRRLHYLLTSFCVDCMPWLMVAGKGFRACLFSLFYAWCGKPSRVPLHVRHCKASCCCRHLSCSHPGITSLREGDRAVSLLDEDLDGRHSRKVNQPPNGQGGQQAPADAPGGADAADAAAKAPPPPPMTPEEQFQVRAYSMMKQCVALRCN